MSLVSRAKGCFSQITEHEKSSKGIRYKKHIIIKENYFVYVAK